MFGKLNLVGKRFGKLLVIEEAKDSTYIKDKWICKCDCGNTVSKYGVALFREKNPVKTCGCHFSGKESPLFKGYEEISGAFWSNIKNNAKHRDVDFELSVQQAWEKYLLQDRKCAITGIGLRFNSSNSKTDGNASLDRIDSSRGYYLKNIQWVDKMINKMKLDLSQREFILICHSVAKNNPI
jgi:hypothetical protein